MGVCDTVAICQVRLQPGAEEEWAQRPSRLISEQEVSRPNWAAQRHSATPALVLSHGSNYGSL